MKKNILIAFFIITSNFIIAQTYYAPTAGILGSFAGGCPIGTNTGTYVDDGGVGGNYSTNINGVYQTICPTNTGESISITFSSFNMENGWDYIVIGNGPAQNSTAFTTAPADAMGWITGTPSVPFTYTATNSSGCLTIRLTSDFITTAAGFQATISTVNNGTALATGNSDCNTSRFICSNTAFNDVSYGPGIAPDEACVSSCLTGEVYSNWYTFTAMTTGTIELTIAPNTGTDDFDFAIFGPGTSCGAAAPVKCSFSGVTGNTGLTSTSFDSSEGAGGDGWLSPLNVIAGETYQLMVNNWSPGGAGFDLNFSGSATIGTPAPAINSASVCGTQTTILTATPTKPGGVYSWSTGESTQSISVSPAVTTTYTCSYTIDGCTSISSGSGTVTVTPVPTANISYIGSPFCTTLGTQTVVLTGTNSYTGGVFSSTAGLTINAGSGLITPSSSTQGTYTVNYAIPVVGACPSTNVTTSITIDGTPTAIAGGTQNICSTGTATVSGASATNGSILWTHNGTGTLTGATTLTPQYSPSLGDIGNTVTLTMTVTSNNSCGGTATAIYSVQVDPLPTASAGGTATICSNGTVVVSGAIATNGTIAWTENGSGFISANGTTNAPTYSAALGDAGNTVTLTMTVTSNNACAPATASAIYSVIVDPLPTATAGGTQTICQNGIALISGATSTNGTILWTHNGAGSISNSNTIAPTYNAVAGDAGNTVTLTLTVTSTNSCAPQTATASYTVNVNANPTFTYVATDPTTCNGTDGSINIQGLNNNSNYSISFTTPLAGTTPFVSDASGNYLISNLPASTYTITNITLISSGCQSTGAVINLSNPGAPSLVVTDPIAVCSPLTVDITLPATTAGSTGVIGLSYWTDGVATIPLGTPNAITTTGIYYIKATNGICTDIKPVNVTVNTTPILVITNPSAVCTPLTVDITLAAITTGSTGGGTLSYWTDGAATIPLGTPTSIGTSGTYYIKADNMSCVDIKPVIVTINATPVLVITNPSAVCSPATVDITLPAITAGSTGGGTLSYWTDASATSVLGTPTSIGISGTYYIKADNASCIDINPVVVTINSLPTLIITDPAAVCSPLTVDVTLPAITAGSTGGGTLSYWTDAGATSVLGVPTSISLSGTYYIKADNFGCVDIKPVNVLINTSPVLVITDPLAVCSPLTVDITLPAITSGSTGGGTLSYWSDASATIVLAAPSVISTSGIYYIKTTTGSGCTDVEPVNVTINISPNLTVNDPASVCSPLTVDITLPAITAGSTGGGTLSYWSDASATIVLGTPTAISSSGIYYIKAITGQGCFDVQPVNVIVNLTPDVDDITDIQSCDSLLLPVITGVNLTGNEAYFLGANGTSVQYQAGDLILNTVNLIYIYDAISNCSSEESFSVTINSTDDPTFIFSSYCEGTANGPTGIITPGGSFNFNPSVVDGAVIDQVTGVISNGVGGSSYSVEYITNGTCPDTLDLPIIVFTKPSAPLLSASTTYCLSDSIFDMTATSIAGNTINWYESNNLNTIFASGNILTPVATTMTYNVNEISSNSCVSDYSLITITIEHCDVVIPTAFTPDDDKINDTWELKYLDVNFPKNSVKIYNRWGNIVFESKEGQYELAPWDGKVNGEILPVASYYYSIEYNQDGKESARGIITIIKQ
ncbi:MAG: gliding motility-associated C-terminal domain-containing protein [Flavobacteriia bacterium]|nr:gliding motility-associated C-terminal domain-containing protein [Flavobacteriia bacterium]